MATWALARMSSARCSPNCSFIGEQAALAPGAVPLNPRNARGIFAPMNRESGLNQCSESARTCTIRGSAAFYSGWRLVRGAALAILLLGARVSFAGEKGGDPEGAAPGFQSAI